MGTIEKIEPLQKSAMMTCDVARDREVDAYVLTFQAEGAVITVRVILEDEQSGADMVITNMTTLPDEAKGKGYGTSALQILLLLATAKDLREVRAVQVQRASENFWRKNGFVPLRNATNDFRYVPPRDSG
jgi:hypothetical protein